MDKVSAAFRTGFGSSAGSPEAGTGRATEAVDDGRWCVGGAGAGAPRPAALVAETPDEVDETGCAAG